MGWRRFLDSLDQRGAHYLILTLLMILGMVAWKIGFPIAQAIVMQAFGAILYSMKIQKMDDK
jgi:hypothetical protein